MCWTPYYANKHKKQDVIPYKQLETKTIELVTDITTDLQAYNAVDI